MSVTLFDIAKKLGLSLTTVSRVLNGRESALVSESTKSRVLKAAKDMKYTPNRIARALVTGKSQSIALWVWGVHPSYYSSTIYTINQLLSADNYDVQVIEIDDAKSLTEIASWTVDGIIAFDCSDKVQQALQDKKLLGSPIVILGEQKLDNVDSVSFDLGSGTKAAMEHLLSTGRKRISFFATSVNPEDTRLNGYIQAMADAGLEAKLIISELACSPIEQLHRAYVQMNEYLSDNNPPDAIFCYNDQTAIGVYRSLYEHRIQIPDDIMVTGCDGIEMSEYVFPKLTTITIPLPEMCAKAWEYLKNRIENPSISRQSIIFPCELTVRDSSHSAM